MWLLLENGHRQSGGLATERGLATEPMFSHQLSAHVIHEKASFQGHDNGMVQQIRLSQETCRFQGQALEMHKIRVSPSFLDRRLNTYVHCSHEVKITF
jgi:hypothetical protein